MKRLKINLAALGEAFDQPGWATSHFLDTESGEVIKVTEETRHILDDLTEMYSGDKTLLDNLDEILARRGLRENVSNDLRLALRIEEGYGTRYLKIPETDSIEGYADMKAFIDTVADTEFREQLWVALRGQGAPQRFRDTLARDNPAEQARWLAFKSDNMRKRVYDWLASEGIEAE